MNPRTKKLIDNKIFEYLEEEEPFWLLAIIDSASEILKEKTMTAYTVSTGNVRRVHRARENLAYVQCRYNGKKLEE